MIAPPQSLPSASVGEGGPRGHLVATVAVLAMFGARAGIDPWLPDKQPFTLFYAAVAIAAWWGGLRPALVALVASGFLAQFFFVSPRGSISSDSSLLGLAAFSFTGCIIVAACVSCRRARHQADQRLAELHQVQARIKEAQDSLDHVVESISDGFILLDGQARLTYVNSRGEQLFGKPRAELLGRCLWEVVPGLLQTPLYAATLRSLKERTIERTENIGPRSGRWFETIIAPARQGVSMLSRDIHEHKLTAEKLREAEKRLRIAQRAARVGVFEFDYRTGRNEWTPEMERLYGLEPGTFTGTGPGWLALVHPEDRARAEAENARAVVTGEYALDFRAVHPDGTVRWLLSRGSVIYDEDRQPLRLLGANVDITEQREAELRLESVLSSIGDHLVTYDLAWRFTYINEGGARMLGYEPADLVGRCVWDVFPESVGNQYYNELHRALSTQEVLRSQTYNATAGRWFENHVYPTPSGVTIFSSDITARKQTEEQLDAAQKALAEYAGRLETAVAGRTRELREKIGELETFSFALSHDLRSPLRVLNGYAQALVEDHAHDLCPEAAGYVDRIARGAQRLDRLIQDVLLFSRLGRDQISLGPVELGPLLAEIIEHYDNLQPHRVRIDIRLPLRDVHAHPALLTQCVANILGNAIKFVATGVKPAVEIWTESPGANVRLCFRDNGIGIAPEHHARIFALFERLHGTSAYDGTGIGLAVVQKAAVRMGGRAGVHSTPGHGSTFWLELPAASTPAGQRRPVSA